MRRRLGVLLLDGLEGRVFDEVIATASEKLGVAVDLLGRVDLKAGFDQSRKQWRADEVIKRHVESFSSPSRFSVGLMGVDLYVPPLNFVFGLAMRNRRSAVVSWFRLLNDDDLLATRIAKEIIHETGHLEGLDHCANRSCVMWFSNDLSETDAKGLDFCDGCARRRPS